MNHKQKLILVIILFLLVPIIISIVLLNNSVKVTEIPNISLPVVECKPVTKPCYVQSDKGTIAFLLPANARYLEQFPVQVILNKRLEKQVVAVSVDFKMTGMDMGLNRYHLIQGKEQNQPWSGNAVLPVCASGRTDWEARVSVKTNKEVLSGVFRFEVDTSKK